MKIISHVKTHVDYTSGNIGVRVWKDRFQQIHRDTNKSEWYTVGGSRFSIPASKSQLSSQFARLREGAPDPFASQIAATVGCHEREESDPELRELLMGSKPF